jgi:hypothetical protein
LRYDIIEKQTYAMVKALTDFRTYVLHSRIIAYVPTSFVKDIMVHPNSDRRRGRWIAKIQEFDLEVKPTNLVKGHGLDKLLAESNFRVLGINHLQAIGDIPMIEEFVDQIPLTQIHEFFSS